MYKIDQAPQEKNIHYLSHHHSICKAMGLQMESKAICLKCTFHLNYCHFISSAYALFSRFFDSKHYQVKNPSIIKFSITLMALLPKSAKQL